MDGRTLSRLRLAFVVLGIVLLAPLWLLVRSAQARLEEQRRLRHEIVAERIFDEMERELGELLERERLRPSSAYAAVDTDPLTWAPFVVGYFTHDKDAAHVTARDQLVGARAERVRAVADSAWQRWAAAHAPAIRVPDDQAKRAVSDASDAAKAAAPAPSYALSNQQEEVLRKLNRGSQKRSVSKQQSLEPKAKAREQANGYDDPLLGL